MSDLLYISCQGIQDICMIFDKGLYMSVAILCRNRLGNTKYVKETKLVFKHLNNKAFSFYIFFKG